VVLEESVVSFFGAPRLKANEVQKVGFSFLASGPLVQGVCRAAWWRQMQPLAHIRKV
jgi:hypothetical protein